MPGDLPQEPEAARISFSAKRDFMTLDQTFFLGLYGSVCVFGLRFLHLRWLWRRRKRQGNHSGFYPRGAALGNALHQLQAIAEPQTKYVIEEKLDEEGEEDYDGGPDDPVRHLHRQAKKIRRGEPLERLTTFLPSSE
jgi:hypothetical protein